MFDEFRHIVRTVQKGQREARQAKKEMVEAKALRKLKQPSRSHKLRSFWRHKQAGAGSHHPLYNKVMLV